MRKLIEGLKEALADMSDEYKIPKGMHKATMSVERKRDAAPLDKAASKMIKSKDMKDRTQARYLKGMATAVLKGDDKAAKEFYSKLSKKTVTHHVPMNLVKRYK